MAKNGVFKKITALAMAIALVVCFAVSASATVNVNVATTTEYKGNDIEVVATVTGISKDTNVTYYATRQVEGNTVDVHIDQQKAGDNGAVFRFNVDSAAELNSAVVIGYTGASEAETGETIPGYTVTYPDGSTEVIPTKTTSLSFEWSPDTDMDYNSVSTTGAVTDVVANYNGTNVNITFNATGDFAITVNQKPAVVDSAAGAYAIDAAALISKGTADKVVTGGREDEKGNVVNGEAEDDATVNAEIGARKITVIGRVTDATEYGIIVSKETIVGGDVSAAAFEANYRANAYAGATKANNTGLFAVQLIDTSDASAEQTDENRVFIEANATYHTAVYAKDSNGAFTITVGKDVVVD